MTNVRRGGPAPVSIQALTVALAACALAACGGSGSTTGQMPRPASSSAVGSAATAPTAGSSATASPGGPVEVDGFARAYPGVPVVNVPAALGGDRYFAAAALTPEGGLVGSVIDGRHFERQFVLLDPLTRAVTLLGRIDTPTGTAVENQVQVQSADADTRTIAWVLGDVEGTRWRLLVRDRETGRTRLVARNAVLGGGPCPLEVSPVRLSGEWVYWSACAPAAGVATLVTYRASVTGGAPVVLHRQASEPAPLARGVAVWVPTKADPKVGEVRVLPLSGSASAASAPLITKPLSGWAAGDRLAVYMPLDQPEVTVLDRDRTGTSPLTFPATAAMLPRVWRDWATWEADDGGRLYDARSGVAVRLDTQLDEPLLGNGYLLWSEAPAASADALFTTTYHLVQIGNTPPATPPPAPATSPTATPRAGATGG